MHEEVFWALADGATIVTATHRLARVLIDEFHSQQRAQGRSTWEMPDALPYDAFLDRLWTQSVLRGTNQNCPRLLDPLQEQIVWEQVIRESPAGETLLQIAPTAQTAMNAWKLLHACKLPVDGRFEATDDWSVFHRWSERFGELCEVNGWLARARLGDFLVEKISAGEISLPRKLYLAGFHDLTPQQAELFQTCRAHPVPEDLACAPAIDCRKANSVIHEIESAAEWARDLLEQDTETQIGIVVPDLTRLAALIERLFRRALDPAADLGASRQSFHVSVGPFLLSNPLVHAALLMLEFATGPLSLPRAGVLLRSPFLGGAAKEASQRALLDSSLRKRGIWHITVPELRQAAANCPILQRALQRFERDLRSLPERQSATEWSRTFSRLLRTFGWPGDRPPDSREHQVIGKWQELLSSLAALDICGHPQSAKEVLNRLRQIAAHTSFQVENRGAPIQIMGMLEAAGLRFDHLWIMGLDDESLPKRADPNPFIPISLQRERRLPNSSANVQLEFARRQLERLRTSAPDVVMSYSEREGDWTFSPSPLAAGTWRSLDVIAHPRASVGMEQLEDMAGPAVDADTMQPGGSSLFKDMAACPFRAFAKHRLHAYPLEESKPGLSRKDQGTGVHKALELIWHELGSHSRLCEFTEEQLQELVARSVELALKDVAGRSGQNVERRRLQSLLLQWLHIEKSRSPFTISNTEHQSIAVISSMQVRTRADRIDVLPDGRQVVIDYKTGRVGSNCWEGDRPDEPQLPLYCVMREEGIAGAAFALLRTGEMGFRGIAVEDVCLPGAKNAKGNLTFHEKIREWKRVLEALAGQFQAGRAEVDPKPDACDNCGLTALCRIRELQNDRG